MKEAIILLGICFVLSCWVFVVGHQLGVEIFRQMDGLVIPAYTFSAFTGGIAVVALIGAIIER